jgi:hypothetical protein
MPLSGISFCLASVRRGIELIGAGGATCKIPDALVLAVVFTPRRVVPLDAEPRARGADNFANVSDGAERAIIRPALADLSSGRHVSLFGGRIEDSNFRPAHSSKVAGSILGASTENSKHRQAAINE